MKLRPLVGMRSTRTPSREHDSLPGVCRHRVPPHSYLLSLTLFSVAIIPVMAQQAAPDSSVSTFRTSARTVIVDVVVTDRDGHTVTGLPRKEFQIAEDGKPQSITFFEEHSGPPPSAAPPSGPPAHLPENTFSNVPIAPLTDSVNLLLMDALNTPMADQMYVHKEMLGSPPDETGVRYGRLLAYFSQVGCTAALMEEQAIPGHQERNLLCTLPGADPGEIVVSTHYEPRQNQDPTDPNCRSAVILVQLYKALQAQTRNYTYVFAELSGDDGEKRFLGNLASTQYRFLRAAVAFDLPVPGRWQYELSWNAFLIAGPHPGDMSPAQARWQDTTSFDVVRTKALRAAEATKALLVSSLMESAKVNAAGQPIHLKPPHDVQSARLFRHSTDIPSILIYSVPAPQHPSTTAQTSKVEVPRPEMFDSLADYLCRLDDNLATLSSLPH